jgi:S-adenosylmethionine:tRNA ribosyltransferase-isomerase
MLLFGLVDLKDFIYDLPDELIAQEPLAKRDESRLMVVDKSTNSFFEKKFTEVTSFFNTGDVLVLNDTKVIPARLLGTKSSGAKVEVFLLRKLDEFRWHCLVKPGAKLQPGSKILIGEITATILDRTDDGGRIVEFSAEENVILGFGKIPLPPYVHNTNINPERYQTVFAQNKGAVAAPTAGLHFTPELLTKIESLGVQICKVTLHVGIGTFRPIKVENVDKHKMDFEWYNVSKETADTINNAKSNGGKIIACGTTVVRTLESCSDESGLTIAKSAETDLFIKPGFKFRTVDRLITNFHLPGSTLLLLVSAFANRGLILSAYNGAVAKRFRFFSFGDAMIIL